MTSQASPSQPAREPALERAFSRIRHAARDLPDGRIMVILDRSQGQTTGCWIRPVSLIAAEVARAMSEPPGRK